MSRGLKKIILGLADAFLIATSFTISHIFLTHYVNASLLRYFPTYLLTVFFYIIVGSIFKVFSRINRYLDLNTITSVTYTLLITFSLYLIIDRALNIPQLLAIPIRLRFVALSYLFSVLLICLSRFTWTLMNQKVQHEKKPEITLPSTIVIGAGEASNVLFKSLETEEVNYSIVGVLDDNVNKKGTYFHNVRVYGTVERLAEVIRKLDVKHVIIAIPSLAPDRTENIVSICNSLGVTVNRMPHVGDILAHGFSMSKLRDVSVCDLLGRDVVELDVAGLRTEFAEKVVLVTGAGGSIGSEICRQVLTFNPKKIILVGRGENSIYQIHRELNEKFGNIVDVIPVIADVKDRGRIFEVMNEWCPDIIYHAAAHKHVPLMEINPMEAIKNNVYGTKNVAEAAIRANVSKFVMVSTDKAVNPTNVMGASKRIAEMIVTALSDQVETQAGITKFSAVRFGNVLGSRGSVIPLFKEQIAKGGPVTVTDFRMTRYFMTIPEASRLVIQSGMLSRGGEVFVLDMGKAVRIYDLAKKLITLSGFDVDEIEIVESGIRPGEKLYEELLLTGEEVKKNIFEKIFVGQVCSRPLEEVMAFVDGLKPSDDLSDKIIAFANKTCTKE